MICDVIYSVFFSTVGCNAARELYVLRDSQLVEVARL